MLCQNCGKNPVELFIEIHSLEGKEKIALCRECFKDYYSHLLNKTLRQIIEKTIFGEEKTCPYCGKDLDEIKEEKKVGCVNCFKFFKEEIEELIKKRYGNKTYKGRAPKFYGDKMEEILKNKILLSKAIEEENYERAAEIRDYLRKLMKG
jgi:protein arginine kinase activator